MDIFSNREIAIAVWLTIFFIFFARKRSLRESIVDLLKAFFDKRILIVIFLMSLYIIFVTWLLSYSGLWDSSQIKNTIIWSATVATVMLFRANIISENIIH